MINDLKMNEKLCTIRRNILIFPLSTYDSVSVASAKKQAAEEAKNAKTKVIVSEPVRKVTANTTSKAKVKRKSQKMSHLAKKKKKLYCICQTPYDDSKYAFFISISAKIIRFSYYE